ncbi:PAS-domain containing protein [Thioclava sp. GXIMD4216]|uniref:hybrid sensor histidine kinase/response regulator n=1 Tax=Thioclava sp. GXIMD4216 TaxID=3131929 RepID=UPI0030CB398C
MTDRMPDQLAASLLGPGDDILRQNEKLLAIASALIRHAESSRGDSEAGYAQFERAALLEDQVRERTRDLEKALDLLNMSNARLAEANRETESARQNLASAIETVQEGFALFDAHEQLVMCNTRFNALLIDIRADLKPGLGFLDYLDLVSASSHLHLPAGMTRADWVAMRRKRHDEHHFIFNQEMGDDRWIQVSEHRTRDGGTVILQTEVTDLIRREREERGRLLDDQTRILQATLEHLKLGACIFDARLRLLGWNERLAELLLLPRNRLRRGMQFDLLLEQVRDQFVFPHGLSAYRLADWVRRARRRDNFQMELTREGGQVYDLYAQELPDGGFVMSLTDITAERQAISELSRAKDTLEARVMERTLELEDALSRAERANASRARFVAAASHDLLQPLSAAKLYMASLSDETMSPLAATTLEKAQNALLSVEGILSALLDISRLEAGKAAVHPGPIPLAPMFRALRDEFTPIAEMKGLQLLIRDTEAVVVSDNTYLRRILQNLISNAIRYTPKGRVLVRARHRRGAVRVEVRDSGPGIPDDEQELIFREFHRVNAKASASEGMGLGLAIVERAAALLSHPLTLRSQLGCGATFSVEIPLARKDSLPKPAADLLAYHASEPDSREQTVLLVENDAELSRAMVQLLEKWGINVLDVSSAEEALELIADTGVEPDFWLVDYQLGEGMNGVELIRMLRQQQGDIKVRLVTANRSLELMKQAEAEKITILPKPIVPAALSVFFSGLEQGR